MTRAFLFLAVAFAVGMTQIVLAQDAATPWAGKVDADYHNAPQEAVEAWKDLKFGMRIHWGVYSVLGLDASWPTFGASPEFKSIYNTLYQVFNPTDFDADAWADLMVRAGFKYFVFTAKHVDGFCMYDTKTTVRAFQRYGGGRGIGKIREVTIPYGIMDTLFQRDIVKEIVDAGRRRGLGIGLYYPNQDWFDRDQRFVKQNMFYDPQFKIKDHPEVLHRMAARQLGQLRELCSNYGPLQQIDLDCGWPEELWPQTVAGIKEVRRLQPNVMLRERGIGPYGDFATPEHWIPDDPHNVRTDSGVKRAGGIAWQAIEPLGSAWAYQPNDTYKPKEGSVATLIACCAKGGNFMPGVSPMANGRFPQETIDRILYAGAWLKVNGEAIYGTRPREGDLWKEGDDIRFTRSKDGKRIFAIALKWPGERLTLKTLRARPGSTVRMLGFDEPLAWHDNADGALVIEIPAKLQKPENRPCPQAWAFCVVPEE